MKLIIDFILIVGLLTCLVFIIKICKAKIKLISHKILIAIFASLIIIILNFYADLHDINILYIITLFFEDASRILLGGLIFIYIKSLFIEKKKLNKTILINVAPYVLYTIIFSLPILLINFGLKTDFKYLIALKHTSNLNFFKAIYLLVYILLSLRLFNHYKKKYKLDYSTFYQANFIWVKRMLIGAFIVICVDVFTFLIDYLYDTDFDTGFITVIALIVIVFYLGNYGINQPFVFLSSPLEHDKESSKNVFSKKEIETLKYKIENTLHYEKLYLNQELTLKKLANKAEISDKKLSFFLNQHLNTSFYDLINSYRIKEFKEKINLSEYEKYSLVGIAYTCGFNSKSSFYRIFKKETGISPAQFKKNTANKS